MFIIPWQTQEESEEDSCNRRWALGYFHGAGGWGGVGELRGPKEEKILIPGLGHCSPMVSILIKLRDGALIPKQYYLTPYVFK